MIHHGILGNIDLVDQLFRLFLIIRGKNTGHLHEHGLPRASVSLAKPVLPRGKTRATLIRGPVQPKSLLKGSLELRPIVGKQAFRRSERGLPMFPIGSTSLFGVSTGPQRHDQVEGGTLADDTQERNLFPQNLQVKRVAANPGVELERTADLTDLGSFESLVTFTNGTLILPSVPQSTLGSSGMLQHQTKPFRARVA